MRELGPKGDRVTQEYTVGREPSAEEKGSWLPGNQSDYFAATNRSDFAAPPATPCASPREELRAETRSRRRARLDAGAWGSRSPNGLRWRLRRGSTEFCQPCIWYRRRSAPGGGGRRGPVTG